MQDDWLWANVPVQVCMSHEVGLGGKEKVDFDWLAIFGARAKAR